MAVVSQQTAHLLYYQSELILKSGLEQHGIYFSLSIHFFESLSTRCHCSLCQNEKHNVNVDMIIAELKLCI
jgi:hypothetical protein